MPTIFSAETFRRTYAGFHLGKEKTRTNVNGDHSPKDVSKPWDIGDLEFQGDAQLFDHGLVCGKGQIIVSALLGDLP